MKGTWQRQSSICRRPVDLFIFVFIVVVVIFGAQRCLLSPSRVMVPQPTRSNPAFLKDVTHDIEAQKWKTDQVAYDKYSLLLRGQRVFLHSGEFHTFRLPVPSLWTDIMQKFKAAGMNAVSLYTHMGIINPSRGILDFNDWRALKPFYEAVVEAGLWVVLRPGPVRNSLTVHASSVSKRGIAHWATSEVSGMLRTDATDWRDAWTKYIKGIIEQSAPYQITQGGPIIAIQLDNEYEQWLGAEYFEDLKAVYHNLSIVVPLTYNDPGPRSNFINGTGAVDLYGLDGYPQRFDCSNPLVWNPVPLTYHDYHMSVNPSQPWYIPEFQAGSYDAWGPSAPGYGPCAVLTGPDFMSVFNRQLWASNAKLINYYMLYGGTSWGAIPFPGVFVPVYTSYDYGSAISEDRTLTSKFDELKLESFFIRSSPGFYKTDRVADTSTGLDISTSPDVFVTLLVNPDTNAGFYVARHNDSSSMANTNFKLTVATAEGELQIPQVESAITLSGRQSKVIITDYIFGSSRVQYSTAQVFFAGVIDDRDVLFLYGDSSQGHEAAIYFTGTPNQLHPRSPFVFTSRSKGATVLSFLPGIQGLVTLYDSDTQLVLFGDTDTAATFWSPVIAGNEADPLRNFWGLGTNASILVGGPYLVRSASITGTELALRGDLSEGARLTVIAPKSIRSISWNGELISSDVVAAAGLTSVGGFIGHLELGASFNGIKVPELKGWKYKDSLPEIGRHFDDEAWVVADHTSTNIPLKPYYGDGRVLYGCDYGFCENIVLWRGHFVASGSEKSVNLSINGGEAFAASVWLNDVFLNTSYGNSTNNLNILEETDDVFVFPEGTLIPGQDNVITIVQDNMGLNETEGANPDSSKGPRGVRGFQLNDGTFSDWKVQGKVGGYTDYPDKVRGIFNEGGLFGERAGWHLPGFDTSSWEYRDLSNGLPNTAAGTGFFVTTFELDIPAGYDVPISFVFDEPLGQPYRVYLFVNGWMMGKRIGNLGPQSKFPVQEGILDYHGENTVAVALWAMEEGIPITPLLRLAIDGVFDGGVGQIATNNPSWSPRGRLL
ncbi:glycoside hydrolase family 35 protein [Armillaria luteobubalina]|uniref:beta-galactosidase n=1 Tax=Armillaria luteobubalina TaxID=153913 RepID=A0AA39QK65_9AGAR|nr:glycoside hydrolase family 35 protein [Armillaria luteobubalina]